MLLCVEYERMTNGGKGCFLMEEHKKRKLWYFSGFHLYASHLFLFWVSRHFELVLCVHFCVGPFSCLFVTSAVRF